MQSSPSTRPFKPTLAGASPATDAILILDFRFAIFDFEQAASSSTDRKSKFKIQKSLRSQGVISSARRSAKAEVRGANPRESAIFLEQHVGDELLQMSRKFPVLARHNDQFSGKTGWERNPDQALFLVVKSQRTDRHEADAHSERHQINDQVKVVELHSWRDTPALPPHPRAQLLACVGTLLNQKPALLLQPRDPCLSRWSSLQLGGGIGRGN